MFKKIDHWTFWLISAFITAVVPHLGHLPWWSIVYFAGPLVVFAFAGSKRIKRKGKWIVRILSLILFLLTVVTFRGTIGRDAGTALLVGLLGLKLLELGSERDKKVFCLLNYFLILTTVLYFQSFLAGLYMFLTALINTVALIRVVRGQGHWPHDVKRVLLILAQALPLAIILFVFFPRIQGSLFGLQRVPSIGISGMSDFLAPGEISSLAMSNKPVFRVSFLENTPESGDRYWRCMVFGDYDGIVWKRYAECPGEEKMERSTSRIGCRLNLEKHNGYWLPAMGLPLEWPRNVESDCYGLLKFKHRVRQRKNLSLVFDPDATLVAENLRPYRELPEGNNPQAFKMGRKWKDLPAKQKIANALEFFRANDFAYTLQPGVMHGDYIDKFLFNKRKGFCEHYASSFAFLMRAAGIPSRVVAGYQGGEMNPLGGYVLVREKDAHAWTEVYLQEEGWKRFDPVALASPTRLEEGFDALGNSQDRGLPGGNVFEKAFGWLHGVAMAWDAANNAWNTWVLDYTYKKQNQLLDRFKLDNSSLLGIVKILAILFGFFAVTFFLFKIVCRLLCSGDKDPVAEQYGLFCSKMARAGIKRPAYMGPLDFCRFVQGKTDNRQVVEILNMYILLRYAENDSEMFARFKRAVKNFDPREVG